MSHHRPPLSQHEVIVARIHARIHELIAPWTTSSDQWLPDEAGTRLVRRTHVVEHSSLIDQLAGCFPEGSSGEASGGGPGSKPPANIAALSQHGVITTEALRWVRYAWAIEVSDVVDALRILDNRASTIEHLDDLKDLDWHVTRWWAHARITTSWDTPPIRPYVPCPSCGHIGGLRVTADPRAAVCLECSEAWDASTVSHLGDLVQMMLEPPASIEDVDPGHDAVAALDEFEERLAAAPSILQGVVNTA